jgi:hypothetical protein
VFFVEEQDQMEVDSLALNLNDKMTYMEGLQVGQK